MIWYSTMQFDIPGLCLALKKKSLSRQQLQEVTPISKLFYFYSTVCRWFQKYPYYPRKTKLIYFQFMTQISRTSSIGIGSLMACVHCFCSEKCNWSFWNLFQKIMFFLKLSQDVIMSYVSDIVAMYFCDLICNLSKYDFFLRTPDWMVGIWMTKDLKFFIVI